MQGGAANASAKATGGSGGFSASGPSAITGTANATSSATTINGYAATAQSTAAGSGGQAQATAQTNFIVSSVQASATSQVGGTGPAIALAQVGSGISTSNAFTAGQSFSVVSAYVAGPLTLAAGSMGASGVGSSLAYQQSAAFSLYSGGVPFVIGLIGSNSLGTGFDSALFQVFDNGSLVVNQSFADLAAAQAYFAKQFLSIYLMAGLNNIQLAFSEMMSGGEGFSFDFATASVSATPLPPDGR
jgi:hypothetical protein